MLGLALCFSAQALSWVCGLQNSGDGLSPGCRDVRCHLRGCFSVNKKHKKGAMVLERVQAMIRREKLSMGIETLVEDIVELYLDTLKILSIPETETRHFAPPIYSIPFSIVQLSFWGRPRFPVFSGGQQQLYSFPVFLCQFISFHASIVVPFFTLCYEKHLTAERPRILQPYYGRKWAYLP